LLPWTVDSMSENVHQTCRNSGSLCRMVGLL